MRVKTVKFMEVWQFNIVIMHKFERSLTMHGETESRPDER